MSDDSSVVAGGPAQLVRNHLNALEATYEVMACDPELADTAAFCQAYDFSPDQSANTIIVIGKSDPPVYVACVVLATTRLDVNGTVRRKLGVKKASFASGDETKALTEMIIGGVTAFGLPAGMPVWVDSRVMERERIVVGGGSRDCKIVGAPTMLTANPLVEIVEGLAKLPDPSAG
jgi:prolyl-tRNA editing enzyme YbaK/EbsC (Cys-tRNA(Pro) deacylase)